MTLRLDTPAARMATISPSLERRPSPIRMPTSTPNGMVSGSNCGMDHAKSSATTQGLALAPTRTANSLSAFCKKVTNVARNVPNSELVRISRKMYRPRMRTPESLLLGQRPVGDWYQVRGRNQRKFWHFLFYRAQLQVVDQQRRGHHRNLGGVASAK